MDHATFPTNSLIGQLVFGSARNAILGFIAIATTLLVPSPLYAVDELAVVSFEPASGSPFAMQRVGTTDWNQRRPSDLYYTEVRITVDYNLDSADTARVVPFVELGSSGGGEIRRGRGRVTARFGANCPLGTAAPASRDVTSVRLQMRSSDGRVLAERSVPVSYRFHCGPDVAGDSLTIGGQRQTYTDSPVRTFRLTAAEAVSRKTPGGCTFDVNYELQNVGIRATPPAFRAQLYLDPMPPGTGGAIPGSAARTPVRGSLTRIAQLMPGQGASYSTRINVVQGVWVGRLRLNDFPDPFEEPNVNNNNMVFELHVDNSCPGHVAPGAWGRVPAERPSPPRQQVPVR